jgi:hypothetical protein
VEPHLVAQECAEEGDEQDGADLEVPAVREEAGDEREALAFQERPAEQGKVSVLRDEGFERQ